MLATLRYDQCRLVFKVRVCELTNYSWVFFSYSRMKGEYSTIIGQSYRLRHTITAIINVPLARTFIFIITDNSTLTPNADWWKTNGDKFYPLHSFFTNQHSMSKRCCLYKNPGLESRPMEKTESERKETKNFYWYIFLCIIRVKQNSVLPT